MFTTLVAHSGPSRFENSRRELRLFFMVAEPTKVLAPVPQYLASRWLAPALAFSMMIGVRGDVDDVVYKQEHQDNIFYKVYDFEMEENEVTKNFQVWLEAEIFGFDEFEERGRWIGTTRTLDSSRMAWSEARRKLWQWSHDHNATEINDKMAMIGDWRPDGGEVLQTSWDWNPTSLEVEDWHLGWNEPFGHGLNFMKKFVNGTNYELIFDIAATYVLVTMEWIASLFLFEFIDYTIMKMVFVLLAAMAGALVIQSKMRKEPKNMKGHLGSWAYQASRRTRAWWRTCCSWTSFWTNTGWLLGIQCLMTWWCPRS